jgi:hypothetical protein
MGLAPSHGRDWRDPLFGLGPLWSHALTLAPLPQPSPADAVWFGRFAGLMDARLG